MCFSPAADFAIAAAISPVAVASLRLVRRREQLLVAALPAVFAAHQFVEGFVWLGLEGHVSSGLQHAATLIYLLVAQALLPVLVPVALLLVEPDSVRRQRWLWPLAVLGLAVGVRMLVNLLTHPITASASDHVVIYEADRGFGGFTAVAYVLATCGPAICSSQRMLRWFGVANLVGLLGAALIRVAAVTSVWCAYAAFASILVLVYLYDSRKDRGRPVPAT
ncbi:hypothetical protein DSM112329_04701 [Paraconexibacter sp. AEG42_29]|uniref:Uncharacterized protein n=1 Tax=Paraconexibacter sp. AEG42_29 TaxID=2997339 RepID=A0AAU7B1D4_9ACTN